MSFSSSSICWIALYLSLFVWNESLAWVLVGRPFLRPTTTAVVVVDVPKTNSRCHPSSSSYLAASSSSSASAAAVSEEEEVDVIVIGSGIGGLSCAALCAKYGYDTTCVEAHDTPGGVAHTFERYNPKASKTIPFSFDSGPSLITGLSSKGTNPLRQVLDAIATSSQIQWRTYNGWLIHDTKDGSCFKLTTGGDGDDDAKNLFAQAIELKAGPEARKEFEYVRDTLLEPKGLSEASAYIPPFALRGGLAAVASLARYTWKLLSIGSSKGALLTGPFTQVLKQYKIQNEFVHQWFDYLAFALSGLDAAHTQAAPVVYMMRDLHGPGAVLDYPMGGMGSLIRALVSGLEQHGGTLRLNSRVERLLLQDNGGRKGPECTGVVLENGTIMKARRGVVCNAPLWNMARILQDSIILRQDQRDNNASNNNKNNNNKGRIEAAVQKVQSQADEMCMTKSFMHLHLGIPKAGLPEDLECHHSVLDFRNVTAEQNMVIISIPTVFDSSLAPPGYHVIHAYTAACDSFEPWESFLEQQQDDNINDPTKIATTDRSSNVGETGKVGCNPNSRKAATYNRVPGYQALKEERAEVLWKAVEMVIPDIRERAKQPDAIVLLGTPLTHRRYNQRFRGTYGPAPSQDQDVWQLNGCLTPITNLLACGDTCFPGIGLPGVAASGTIAANTIATVKQQSKLMQELKQQGALQ